MKAEDEVRFALEAAIIRNPHCYHVPCAIDLALLNDASTAIAKALREAGILSKVTDAMCLCGHPLSGHKCPVSKYPRGITFKEEPDMWNQVKAELAEARKESTFWKQSYEHLVAVNFNNRYEGSAEWEEKYTRHMAFMEAKLKKRLEEK